MIFRPLLIGLAAGQRSMTPLAAVALAARAGGLAPGNGARSFSEAAASRSARPFWRSAKSSATR